MFLQKYSIIISTEYQYSRNVFSTHKKLIDKKKCIIYTCNFFVYII